MRPIKNCKYSVMLMRGGPLFVMVQTFAYFDGDNFRSEDTRFIIYPTRFEPRTSEDVRAHEFQERWDKAVKAGA